MSELDLEVSKVISTLDPKKIKEYYESKVAKDSFMMSRYYILFEGMNIDIDRSKRSHDPNYVEIEDSLCITMPTLISHKKYSELIDAAVAGKILVGYKKDILSKFLSEHKEYFQLIDSLRHVNICNVVSNIATNGSSMLSADESRMSDPWFRKNLDGPIYPHYRLKLADIINTPYLLTDYFIEMYRDRLDGELTSEDTMNDYRLYHDKFAAMENMAKLTNMVTTFKGNTISNDCIPMRHLINTIILMVTDIAKKVEPLKYTPK